jgi:hypothetical protein
MKKRVLIVVTLAIFAAGMLVLFFTQSPDPVPGSFPSGFPESDRRQIASAVYRDGYARSLRALKSGQIKAAWHQLTIAKRQKVWTVRYQRDGESVWVHVGFENPSQSDGYSLTARYIIKKQGDRWVISGSDI